MVSKFPAAAGAAALAILVVALAVPAAADAGHQKSRGQDHMGGPTTMLLMPMMDPQRGKKLFVSKGCIACHALNGVGGHDAPNLDAHSMMAAMNPFDFAAKMWRGAPAMIAAQEGAFDEQILFTGNELADIIAFVHSHAVQHEFSEHDLTPMAQKMMDHDHGGMAGRDAHAEELGHMKKGETGAARESKHAHSPGTPAHKD